MIAIAALGSSSKATVSERALSYTVSNNLLVNGSDAIERIMSSYKEGKQQPVFKHFFLLFLRDYRFSFFLQISG